MNHKILTPKSAKRGRCSLKALKVPSGVNCLTFTSYITEEYNSSSVHIDLDVNEAGKYWHPEIKKVSKIDKTSFFFIINLF